MVEQIGLAILNGALYNIFMVALLIKSIALDDKRIPADTTIFVDLNSSVGYFNGIHFDVYPDEYILLN